MQFVADLMWFLVSRAFAIAAIVTAGGFIIVASIYTFFPKLSKRLEEIL